MKTEAFDYRLESMRGIAAFVVAANHAMNTFDGAPYPQPVAWLLFFFHPNSAVIFFFVLSGYVLGLSLGRDGRPVQYFVRRFLRLEHDVFRRKRILSL